MKKRLFLLAGLLALGGMGYFGTWVSAQNNGAAPAAAKPTTKIGVVNLAKVMKNFDKANYMGDTLLKDVQAKENTFNEQMIKLSGEEQRANTEPDVAKREAKLAEVRQQKHQLNEQALTFKKQFADKQSEMAVSVNKEITAVIDSCAKQYGLELVMSYGGVADDKEVGTATDAFRRLAISGSYPMWVHPGLDLTDVVVATLNKYFPKPAGTAPAVGVTETK